MITDAQIHAAIEAGAHALAAKTEARDHNHQCPCYDRAAVEDCTCYVLRKARKRARTAINAALPHLGGQ